MRATVLLIQIEGTDADLAPVLDMLRTQISGETPPAAPALPDARRDPAPDYSGSHSAPAPKRRGRGPGRRGAHRAAVTADERVEPSEPPRPGKAQRLKPGPSTIGVGPPRQRDVVSGPDAEAIRILERNLPNVGDSMKLVEFGDLGVRVAVREAAFGSPRFSVESKGRGVPVVIRRVG